MVKQNKIRKPRPINILGMTVSTNEYKNVVFEMYNGVSTKTKWWFYKNGEAAKLHAWLSKYLNYTKQQDKVNKNV